MHRHDEILWALARCPFLTAEDLTLLTGIQPRAARAKFLRLCRAGLADSLSLPGTCQHVYYLTPAGIAAAAAETDSTALAARYGLGEPALLRRLPILERLVAGRRILLALQRELAVRGGTLEQWRAWPVPWPDSAPRGTQRRMLYLDGEGVLRLPGEVDTCHPLGVLWDGDGDTPHAVLDERLAGLDRLCAHTLASGPRAPRVPPILLVTAASDRIPSGYRPHLLWTTCAEIACRGVLDAAWRGAGLRGDVAPLPAALAASVTLSGPTIQGFPVSRAETPLTGGASPPGLRLQERIAMLRRGTCSEASLPLLALAVPPRGFAILTAIGQHPLLTGIEVAEACDLNGVDTWNLLAQLRRHRLITAWMPPPARRSRHTGDRTPTMRRTARYTLTRAALRLLAARVDLSLDAYRRIYGALAEGAKASRNGMTFARRNLAHTDGINQLYLALLGAGRACGGHLEWRGEWACTRAYLDGPHRRILRPDARGIYRGPDGTLRFYVEVDRGTTQMWYLTSKLAQYATYRVATGRTLLTLLLVTNGPMRARHALEANATLPERVGLPPLDLRVTTHAEVAEYGEVARFWSAAGRVRVLPIQIKAPPSQPPLTKDTDTDKDAGKGKESKHGQEHINKPPTL